MRIEVKGRNLQVTDEHARVVERRFDKVAKQVSRAGGARGRALRGAQPGQPDRKVAEATLHLKGVTLRAKDASQDHKHAINLVADDLARQVKRHRDKRRKRRESRAAAAQAAQPRGAEPEEDAATAL